VVVWRGKENFGDKYALDTKPDDQDRRVTLVDADVEA
jgi:hypothetical protein